MTATAARGGSTYEFDVFVSYAHVDAAFVADLVRRLRSSGLRVWLDEERMWAGPAARASLSEALAKCKTLVCVATRSWEESNYTQWEAKVFREQDEERQELEPVKVWRPQILVHHDHKHRVAANPVHLHETVYVEWPIGADPDVKLWEVFCAVCQKDKGPRAEWQALGRHTQALPPPDIPATLIHAKTRLKIPPLSLHVVLGCGRDEQWGQLVQFTAIQENKGIFLFGPQREGHAAFLNRLRHCLPNPRPQRVVDVKWNPPQVPIGPDAFFEALGRALDCEEQNLEAKVRSQLTQHDLILVHQPVAQEAFERDDLVDYYKLWLPAFIEKLDSSGAALQHGIKAIQAIAWRPKKPAWRRLLANFLGPAIDESLTSSEEAARRLIGLVAQQPHPRLQVLHLEELRALTDQVIGKWIRLLPYPAEVQQRLLQIILASGPDSESRLAKIFELLAPSPQWSQDSWVT